MSRVNKEQEQQERSSSSSSSSSSRLVLPGDPLPFGESYLLGLNTHVENGVVRSSVCGVLQTVNRLVYVRPLRSRYEANVGDVVVGRVAEISNGKSKYCGLLDRLRGSWSAPRFAMRFEGSRRRWFIDVRAARLAVLSLGAVSLEVQRRRLDADADGQILLHTRSARYGKQLNGLGLKVPPQLLILGVNGYLWVSLPAEVSAAESMSFSQQQQQEQRISAHLRRQLATIGLDAM
ncbi:hypothetical protein Emag_000160 [Eimeria magna]